MAAESIRYIKAKLAKGKFLKGELRTWLQLLDKAQEEPMEVKHKQTIPPLFGFVRVNIPDDDHVHIQGLDHIQTQVKENEFTVMSPDWPVTQHYETYYHPMELRDPEEEYMSGFDEYVKEEEDFCVKKRKCMEFVEVDIEDSPTNRLDLFPVCKKEGIESVESCSGNDYDGGAGGPVPPLFP